MHENPLVKWTLACPQITLRLNSLDKCGGMTHGFILNNKNYHVDFCQEQGMLFYYCQYGSAQNFQVIFL